MTKLTPPPPVVDLKGVYKYHYTEELETAALNGIDLSIQPGEFVAIMGASGSGKSTLLNVIGLIDKPSKGHYFFNGEDTQGLSHRQMAKLRKGSIGFIFQSFNLIDELTAAENVALPLQYLRIPAKEQKSRVLKALGGLNMLHRKDHKPRQLSGGQQQRIAIARATIISPALILADEPTGNLDSENGENVMNILKSFHQQGATIVMVTHSRRDASHAERIVELFDGKTIISEQAYLNRK